MGEVSGGVAFRVILGDWVGVSVANTGGTIANATVVGYYRVIYDDGTDDLFTMVPASITGTIIHLAPTRGATQSGWIVSLNVFPSVPSGSYAPRGSLFAQAGIYSGTPGDFGQLQNGSFATGFIGAYDSLILGQAQREEDYAVWVFQGTVAEDATVGTHTCTLTVSPNGANQLEVLYGMIIAQGLAGLVQNAYITDGTNIIAYLFQATAAGTYIFPSALAASAGIAAGAKIRLSGSMQLILTAQTSTVSDTQTFSLACRIFGSGLPTATLADNTGTPTITVNTNKVL